MPYPHTTFSTTDCNIPHMFLTAEQKAVIKVAMDGGAFINPVAGDISISTSTISSIESAISGYTPPAEGSSLDFGGMLSSLGSLTTNLGSFKMHTDRLSGVDLSNDGEHFGFLGLQGIATAFNGVQEAMKEPDSVIEDNYSQMFSSVLDSGQNLISDVINKLIGINIGEIIGNPNTAEAQGTINSLTSDISSLSSDVSDNMSADNNHLSTSLDTVKKFGLGNVILGMNKDDCFGQKLLDTVGSPKIKEELDKV
jgi:hypothetical protein